MLYTIYKITNLINGKFYIGKHQTNNLDDDYFGSGLYLRRAINKYGLENFKKDILEVFDEEWKMNLAEKIYVVIDQEVSYNLCPGGKGGFGYVNSMPRINSENRMSSQRINLAKARVRLQRKIEEDQSFRDKTKSNSLTALQKAQDKNPNGTFGGHKHSEATKQKMRKTKNAGSMNGQFGTCWITNGQESKTIKQKDLDIWLELGYYKGRLIKF